MSQEPIRILLIDRDEDEYRHFGELLGECGQLHVELSWRARYDEGLEAMRVGGHDLILLAQYLGDRSGLELLAEAHGESQIAPVILLAAPNSTILQQADECGAYDVLDRGSISCTGLERSIRVALSRKRAEDALREEKTRFHSIMGSLREGIAITDLKGRILYANPRMAELTGYAIDEVHGKSVELLLPPAARTIATQMIHRRIQGLSDEYELEMVRKDGSSLWTRVHASPFRDHHGEIVGSLSSHTDITVRKSMELAQEESERRFRTIYDGAALGVACLDGEGRILEYNAFFATMLRAGALEFQQKHFLELIHPAHREEVEEARQSLAWGGEASSRLETRYQRSDGSILWARQTLSRVESGQGEATMYLAMVEDITERKQMEEELRLSQRLDAVGKLSGGIAHSFNNLLTIVLGRSSMLLKRRDLSPSILREMGLIHSTADRAAHLTKKLLAFGRKQVLVPEILDLGAVLRDMEGIIRPLIGEDVELFIDFAAQLDPVKVDRGQIEDVVINLVLNARDAMPDGGKLTIEATNALLEDNYVRAHVGSRVGRHVQLAVTDTGTGMSEEVRSRIFEPFFTTKPKGWGTGLGLSTVYGIITQSGGSIWVYSECGRGTSFKIFLPAATEGELQFVEDVPTPKELVARNGETVLVVEDEEAVREVACDILETRGYTVLQAQSGVEALEISRELDGPIDVVLTDVVMPHMSGPEMAEKLKAIRPGARIVFTSGYPDRGVVRSGMLGPDTPFIQKPYTADALARILYEVLLAPPPPGDIDDERPRSGEAEA